MGKVIIDTDQVTIGSTAYDITNVKYGKKADKVDVTDTGSPADSKEYLPNPRADYSFSFDLFVDEAVALPAFNTPGTVTLNYGGFVITGTGVVDSEDLDGALGSSPTISCSGYFTAKPTETPKTT